ncbi:MAG: LytTR family DNA-binding domain-containing protein [Pseudomonadales bacterium]|jgi:hypothetical protein
MSDERIEPQAWRRFYIVWMVAAFIAAGVQTSSVLMEAARVGIDLHAWQPLVNEYTGVFALVALLPLIRRVDEWVSRRCNIWLTALPAYLLMTVPFALLHSTLFVAVRKVIYFSLGAHYTFGDLSFELLYEYRKFTLGYALAVLSLHGFRHYVLLQRLSDMPEAARPATGSELPAVVSTPRFLARHGNREVIVSAADIRYVEAAGNYVILHTNRGERKLRETLGNMERELSGHDFVRVHRSHLVNLDAVREIQPWFHGDQRIVLDDGTFLNLSRRYRDALKLRMTPVTTGAAR